KMIFGLDGAAEGQRLADHHDPAATGTTRTTGSSTATSATRSTGTGDRDRRGILDRCTDRRTCGTRSGIVEGRAGQSTSTRGTTCAGQTGTGRTCRARGVDERRRGTFTIESCAGQ
ncbi:hypothetical protein, partial [Mycolicibacterium neoaurum]|uniref:hypothetical protein n=1 Tax=Mycolicibacterium neoaurum TaxID=1795 RepID=UPI001F4C866E